jgi:hypothetical protein
MNAKRISNHVKNNVQETNNFSELKRLLKQYEDRIRSLEAEKLREHNQGEELLSMVKRLMAQKKELIEKLSILDNNENNGLNHQEKSVIAETLEFHQQLDGIIKKTCGRGDGPIVTSSTHQEEQNPALRPQCDSVDIFRFQNVKLVNRVLNLQAMARKRELKSKRAGELLSGLLQEPSGLFRLSDGMLRRLRGKLVTSVEGIDEQLVARKLSKRLRAALARIEVGIDKKFEDFELLKEFSLKDSSSDDDGCLGKRNNLSKGMIKQESIEAILRGACLPSLTEYTDTNLPSGIKMSLELGADQEVQEIDLIEGDIEFNTKALDQAEAEVQLLKVKRGTKTKQPKNRSLNKKNKNKTTIDLSKEKNNNHEIHIDFSEDELCEMIGQPNLQSSSLHASSNQDLHTVTNSETLSKKSGSSGSSKVIFKIDREPLSEKKNEPDASAFPQFASPKSSLYFFTSKKNEYDFSFDRSTIQVEKNLGEKLLMSTIQKNTEKENHFRLQR